jgi:hypothetical protein
MLARYHMRRGKPPGVGGIRQDTRKHTRHCLRPSVEMVCKYLEDPSSYSWQSFERDYFKLLECRFADDRRPFDALAALAQENDVYIGCSCPTAKNPNVYHCHTVLALRFMQQRYPRVRVAFPAECEAPGS